MREVREVREEVVMDVREVVVGPEVREVLQVGELRDVWEVWKLVHVVDVWQVRDVGKLQELQKLREVDDVFDVRQVREVDVTLVGEVREVVVDFGRKAQPAENLAMDLRYPELREVVHVKLAQRGQ